MLEKVREKICKHKYYSVIRCNQDEKYYDCVCCKCGMQIRFPKAIGEMYSSNYKR